MADTRAFLAGVADVDLFVGEELMLQAKTLTDSSISIGVTAEEIRGGQGAQLIGRYFHTTTFSVDLTDVLFQLDYIALNIGSAIDNTGTHGGELITEEVIAAENKLTVTGTAHDFMGLGVIGWYKLPEDENWTTFHFNEDAKTSADATVTTGTTYCVKYMNSADAETITVSADFVPDEVTMVMKAKLFKASRGEGISSSSQIGVAEIEVPRFQLNGNMEISMSMTGAANTPLSGQALSTSDGTEGCDGNGYYSRIKRVIFDSNAMDNLTALAVRPSTIENLTATTGTATLTVYGVFSGGNNASRVIAPADLTYTVEPSGAVTVAQNTGIVTAGASAQSGTITITVTGVANSPTATVPFEVVAG